MKSKDYSVSGVCQSYASKLLEVVYPEAVVYQRWSLLLHHRRRLNLQNPVILLSCDQRGIIGVPAFQVIKEDLYAYFECGGK